MDNLEGFGGSLPIDPDSYRVEILDSIEGFKRSNERRGVEIQWAIDDYESGKKGADDGLAFLAAVARSEHEHTQRDMKMSGKLAAAMALDALDAGALNIDADSLPPGILDRMREVAGRAKPIGEAQVAPEPSGEASIEGIGNFDDLPVAEPERPKGVQDADGNHE